LAAAAGRFLRYLDRGPKELFFSDKPRGEDNFQSQNTTQKVYKSTLSILKTVKYSELASVDLVPSPKCRLLFSNQTETKTNKNIETHWPVLYMF
jgi:hypothetical protein